MIGLLKRPGANLRGDLAKLGDAELANRLDEVLREVERLRAATDRSFNLAIGESLLSRHAPRGPLRARPFYRLIWRIQGANSLGGILISMLIPWADRSDERALYLAHCEAKDLMDEIRRRVEARRRTET